ncbi:MAG: AtpZ/AtpI family protein [Nitrospiria bacterium]
MKSGRNQESAWRVLRRCASLGIEMVAAVLLGVWGGYHLDQWLGTAPWFLLAGFLLGAAAGYLNIVRLIASDGAGSEKKKERKD